jgi:hypothetical protein
MDPLSKAAAGIGMAERQLDGAAGKLSRLGTGGADVDEAGAVSDLALAKIQMAASTTVARTISETLGKMVDTYA